MQAYEDEDRKEINVPNILLVEDDEQLRAMLKIVLVDAGYEVSEASNGTRVSDMHQQECFDLVITDLLMPDTEGLTVIRELRRIDKSVRIIAMSGGGQGKGEDYLRIAQKLGAHLTLSKPFSNQEFLEAVRLTLES
jgi:DNA-binding response OmpR family regulator